MLDGDQQPGPAPVQEQSVPVFEAGSADFEEKVLKASMEKPVLAYFTAAWCGPCKQLGPVLEKVVTQTRGQVSMARVNLDENQELAQALRIQSVPTIYAFFQGRPVDAFQGALPEPQVQAFIDKLVQTAKQGQPDAIDIPEALKAAAQSLAEGDLQQAHGIYAQILQQDEKNAQAYAGVIRTLIAAGQIEQAAGLVEAAPEHITKDQNFTQAKTALDLAQARPDEAALSGLTEKVAKKPGDHQARFDLACAQFSVGQKEEAIDNLLEILSKDRMWKDEEARKQLLKFFEALGPVDPLTVASRRKLSAILFS